MKKIIILLFVFSKAYAQEPTYVPMKSNYLFRGIKMDTLFLPPSYADTSTATNKVNFAGSVVRVGSKLYMRNSALTQWVDLTASGGGIGNLQQVTDSGNTTTNDIQFTNDNDILLDTFSAVILSNNSRLQEGYLDAGYGGNKGVALVCGLGYEYKWEGGRLFVMNNSGNAIREARYMFTDIPDSSHDYTKGYYVGSRWILDNGNTYECTDNSLNAAVWVLQPNAFDSTSLSNRINNKVDSVKRIGDSVYFYKNGISYYGFKDSLGSGSQNGRWGNDTALIVLAKVRNVTATTMTRGTVVMLNGATGDVASVIRANNKYDSTSARTIGVVKEPIAAGDTGWVVTQGQASKLNLGAFNEGDALYLDSIDGGLTKTKPVAPYHGVFVGIVERANNGNGLLYTKPLNGYELGELHDVRITSPINNQVLVYSDTQDIWKNRNVYSVVDTTQLSARIDLRVRYSDTASMLSPYQRSITAMKYSDTATMLTPYLRKTDTATLSSRINNKQDQLNGTGFVKASGTTISYDNTTYTSDDPQILGFQALGSTLKGTNLNVRGWSAITAAGALTSQTIQFNPIYLTNAATITGVKWYQSTQGVYTANNYNGVALYSYSGGTLTLVASSTNDGDIWKATSQTIQSKAFSSPYSAAAGIYYLAVMYSSSAQTTAPQVGVAAGRVNGAVQGDFTNSAKLSGALTLQTALPNTQASSGLTSNTLNQGVFLY